MTLRLRTVRRADLAAARGEITDERPDGPDHVRVEASFGDLHHAERVVWTLGADVEVIAPGSLRTRVAAVAALYS